MRQAFNQFV